VGPLSPRIRSGTISLAAIPLAACLAVPPPTGAGGDGSPADLEGDVLYLSFDGPEPLTYAPGATALASAPDGFLVPGRYGDGFDADAAWLGIADLGAAAGPPMTIEAWIYPRSEGCRVILGDASNGGPPDLQLRLTTMGNVSFKSSGAATPTIEVTSSVAVAELETWTHIAVTWDGTTASYYRGGFFADAKPMEVSDWDDDGAPFAAGIVSDGTCPARGILDELKVSSDVKSADQIQASMFHDPTR
jgi:hypothetical protein